MKRCSKTANKEVFTFGRGKKKVSTSGEFHTFRVIPFWNPELLLLSEILKRCFLPLATALLVNFSTLSALKLEATKPSNDSWLFGLGFFFF